MAHNNGMVPRKAGRKKPASGNAAKFQAAVDAMPLAMGTVAPDVAIDPAYVTVPISEFVPHRPQMPAKSEGGKKFKLVSDYTPAGDQRTAIPELVAGVNARERDQVLLGVTGSGKTFTMAKIIEATQRPALILAPNKTLAAQLYSEFKSFFPDNAVEYFVSYYDYYQPEAYIPRSDTYIEKDSSINEEIDRMRHSATRAILERDDVIIVASRLAASTASARSKPIPAPPWASPAATSSTARPRMGNLTALQYRRNDNNFTRGSFRVRGDIIDIFPAHQEDRAWRVELFGDTVDSITEFDPLTGAKAGVLDQIKIYANQPLRHAAPDAAAGDERHQGRAGRHAGTLPRGRQAAGSPAPGTAHHLRPGDDRGHRQLRRHRELFPLADRPQARRAAADPVRISARQRPGLRRRKPCHACRRSAPCTKATIAANRCWPNMASACPAASTTAR